MEEKICGTAITKGKLENVMQKFIGGTSCPKLENIIGKEIAAGEGFISKIIRVELTWNGPNISEKVPKSAIIKAPSVEAVGSLLSKFKSDGETQNNDTVLKMVKDTVNGEATAYKILGEEK